MFRKNQTPVLSSLAKRGIWVLRIGTQNAAINAVPLTTALQFAEKLRFSTSAPEGVVENTSLTARLKASPRRQVLYLLRDTGAAAIVEFTVALPLLVVLVVGIFDFGAAFNLKQELNNAVREGAHFGASQPSNDVTPTNAKPPSVDAIRFLVDSYLQTAKINDCGLSALSEPAGGGLVWTYNANTGCAGTLTLTISRGVALAVAANGSTVNMLCTTVQISYPYKWHFNNVIQLLVPGATYAGVSQIPSDATAANAD